MVDLWKSLSFNEVAWGSTKEEKGEVKVFKTSSSTKGVWHINNEG